MLTVCAGSKYSLHVFKRFFVRIRAINFGENKTRIRKVVEVIFYKVLPLYILCSVNLRHFSVCSRSRALSSAVGSQIKDRDHFGRLFRLYNTFSLML